MASTTTRIREAQRSREQRVQQFRAELDDLKARLAGQRAQRDALAREIEAAALAAKKARADGANVLGAGTAFIAAAWPSVAEGQARARRYTEAVAEVAATERRIALVAERLQEAEHYARPLSSAALARLQALVDAAAADAELLARGVAPAQPESIAAAAARFGVSPSR
jgi:hypothetical protein